MLNHNNGKGNSKQHQPEPAPLMQCTPAVRDIMSNMVVVRLGHLFISVLAPDPRRLRRIFLVPFATLLQNAERWSPVSGDIPADSPHA